MINLSSLNSHSYDKPIENVMEISISIIFPTKMNDDILLEKYNIIARVFTK